jgi:hypothetical protein|eukprot:COSAG06_NODE_695_length_13008_cov_57.728097_12_plen_57_part_00
MRFVERSCGRQGTVEGWLLKLQSVRTSRANNEWSLRFELYIYAALRSCKVDSFRNV